MSGQAQGHFMSQHPNADPNMVARMGDRMQQRSWQTPPWERGYPHNYGGWSSQQPQWMAQQPPWMQSRPGYGMGQQGLGMPRQDVGIRQMPAEPQIDPRFAARMDAMGQQTQQINPGLQQNWDSWVAAQQARRDASGRSSWMMP